MRFKKGDIVIVKQYLEGGEKNKPLLNINEDMKRALDEKIPMVIDGVGNHYYYVSVQNKDLDFDILYDTEIELYNPKINNWKEELKL